MSDGSKTEHAVVVDTGLLCTVTCWPRRQIVVSIPRADEEGFPHVTYHVDGTRQIRSRLGTKKKRGPSGKFHVETGLPRLDAPMPGPVNVFAPTFRSVDRRSAKAYEKEHYSSIVEIPAAAFDHDYVLVSVDIVEPGVAAPAQIYSERFMETDLPGTNPPVRVTVWRPNPNAMPHPKEEL